MTCHGTKKNNSSCTGSLYKCKKCGSVGCSNQDCSNYNFHNGSCMKCGSTDKSSI